VNSSVPTDPSSNADKVVGKVARCNPKTCDERYDPVELEESWY